MRKTKSFTPKLKTIIFTSVKQLKNDGLDEWKDLLPEEVLEFLLSRS